MNRNYLLRRTFEQAKLARILAKAIDLAIVGLVSFLLHPLGTLASLIYLAWADSMHDGRSIGKKVIGLSVVSLEDGTPCSLRQSFIRNLPFTIPIFLFLIPIWGIIIGIIVGTPLVVLELYFIVKLDSGHRLGDVMADTTVMGHDTQKMMKPKVVPNWFKSESSDSVHRDSELNSFFS